VITPVRPGSPLESCCAVLRCAVLCCAALRCAALCCAVLCCAVLRFACIHTHRMETDVGIRVAVPLEQTYAQARSLHHERYQRHFL
jgi:hypothetical protein